MSWMLFLATAGAADTWWVPDPEDAAALETSLATAWPERAVEVIVGPRPPDALGTVWDGQLLVSYGPDGVRHADVEDATVAALLARSWALPELPAATERYLPEAPPPPPPPVVRAPEPEVRDRFRLSTGLGTRGAVGQVRPLEGVRVVNELGRRGIFVQNDVFLGLNLQASNGRTPNGEGVVFVVPLDRLTVGLAAGLETRGAFALRVLAGPELQFVEQWLYYEGYTWESTRDRALGMRIGAGADWDLGRFVVSPMAWARASTLDPVISGGGTLDLRFEWKR